MKAGTILGAFLGILAVFVGLLQSTYAGGTSHESITKFNRAGAALLAPTYLGDVEIESGEGIEVLGASSAYLVRRSDQLTGTPPASVPAATGTSTPAAPSSTPTRTPTSTPACGSHWRTVSSPNPGAGDNVLYGVSALSPSDVWAVGHYFNSGTGRRPLVMRWNGTTWDTMPTPAVSAILRGVAVLSASDAWAVGYYTGTFSEPGGTLIMHWDGAAWSIMPAPSPGTESGLKGIAAASAGDIWAVGSIGSSGGVLILHWDGTSWVVGDPNSGYGYTLNGVTAISANDVWAVGSRQGGPLTMRWNGNQWSVVNTPSLIEAVLHSVDAVAQNDVWAVGTYSLASYPLTMHWNGSQWSVVPAAIQGAYANVMHGVSAIAPDDVWAVGYYEGDPNPGIRALLQHWNGSSWTAYPTLYPESFTSLNAVTAAAPADLWAAGVQYASISSPARTLVVRYSDPCATATATPMITRTRTPTSTLTPMPPPCTLVFTDVPPGHTFYGPVRCLGCRGIISGYSDGTFRPNSEVTRGQLAKIVSNAAGFSENPDPQLFEDVPPPSTFYQWINRLARRGHMGGYVCGGVGEPCISGMPYFRPSARATRGQTSKIVSNAAGFSDIPTGQTFEDVPPSHTFYREIQRLASRSIMGGYPCGGPGEPCLSGKPYFRPGRDVTRGQSAKIVANTFFPECEP